MALWWPECHFFSSSSFSLRFPFLPMAMLFKLPVLLHPVLSSHNLERDPFSGVPTLPCISFPSPPPPPSSPCVSLFYPLHDQQCSSLFKLPVFLHPVHSLDRPLASVPPPSSPPYSPPPHQRLSLFTPGNSRLSLKCQSSFTNLPVHTHLAHWPLISLSFQRCLLNYC